jgi:hypothetical protein
MTHVIATREGIGSISSQFMKTCISVLYRPVIICREDGSSAFIRSTVNYLSDLDLYSSLDNSREDKIERNEIGDNVARTEQIKIKVVVPLLI